MVLEQVFSFARYNQPRNRLFSGFYNAGIVAYQILLRLVAPFNTKARQWVAGRQHWATALRNKLTDNEQPVVWFHAASLGEFEQGRPVIEAFREAYPTHKILLTFFRHRATKSVKIMKELIMLFICPPTPPPTLRSL